MDLNVTINDESMDLEVIKKFLEEANLEIDYYDFTFSIQNGLFTGYSRTTNRCDDYRDYIILDSNTNERGEDTVTISHSSIETYYGSKEIFREESIVEFVYDGDYYTRRDGKVACSYSFHEDAPKAVSSLSSFQGVIDITFMNLPNVKVFPLHAYRLDKGILPEIDRLYKGKTGEKTKINRK